ncbi:hypothetical protein DY000_02013012 [Brassica cretica]|uniref:Uncharacterized protein n=1 Tax=Brassica cretica TaxID=69181 RepID=A0ABQ7CVS8_BRACR|nr:hypothetical protein DY000_02013012 [Brassica cretica]
MNFPNRRFSSPFIREYQTSKGDSGPRKKRPEPKPILHEPKMFPQSNSCPNQKHFKVAEFEVDWSRRPFDYCPGSFWSFWSMVLKSMSEEKCVMNHDSGSQQSSHLGTLPCNCQDEGYEDVWCFG